MGRLSMNDTPAEAAAANRFSKKDSGKEDVLVSSRDDKGQSSTVELVSSDSSVAHNATVRHVAGFDDSEAESVDVQDKPWAGQEHNEPHQVPEEEGHEGEHQAKRRRLRTKTHPSDAPAYPSRALLRKAEFKVNMVKLKQARRQQRFLVRTARAKAIR